MTEKNLVKSLIIKCLRDCDNSDEAQYHDGTIWLTQKMIGELFGVSTGTISDYLKKSFNNKELTEYLIPKKFPIITSEMKMCEVNFYNLDGIVLTGFRINSEVASDFSEWARKNLKVKKEYDKKLVEEMHEDMKDYNKDEKENGTTSLEDFREEMKDFIEKEFGSSENTKPLTEEEESILFKKVFPNSEYNSFKEAGKEFEKYNKK